MHFFQDYISKLELLTKEKRQADERIKNLIEEVEVSRKKIGVGILNNLIKFMCVYLL